MTERAFRTVEDAGPYGFSGYRQFLRSRQLTDIAQFPGASGGRPLRHEACQRIELRRQTFGVGGNGGNICEANLHRAPTRMRVVRGETQIRHSSSRAIGRYLRNLLFPFV